MGMFSSDEKEEIFARMDIEKEYEEKINKLTKDRDELIQKCKTYERLRILDDQVINSLRRENDKLKSENDKFRRLSELHEEKSRLGEELLSDSDLRLKAYMDRQDRIFKNKENHGFNTTNIYQEARYILEEVAELMRAIEKDDMENLKEELADIIIFAYGCAAVARVGNLDDKIFEKMKINEQRVYEKTAEGDFVKTTK